MKHKTIALTALGFLLASLVMLLGPSGSAQAQTAEPDTLTIVKECIGEDDDDDLVFDVIVDFQFSPNIVEAPGPQVNEDTAFDIDNIELACDEFIDIAEADVQPLIDWLTANGASLTGLTATVSEANVPANVTVTFSGDCVFDIDDLEELEAEGLVCTITNRFNTGNTNTNTNTNDINIPIDIRNRIENALNNINDNGNDNQNDNTQDQENEQKQVNDNNQTTTVNSGPSVVIRGLPNAKPASPPPTTGTGPTVVSPPSTGEGFIRPPSTGEGLFIAPPNTGDAGLLSSERSQGSALLPLILLAGVTGVITLAGVKFSRAGR